MISGLIFKYQTEEKFKQKVHIIAGAIGFLIIVAVVQKATELSAQEPVPVDYKMDVTNIIGGEGNPFEEQGLKKQLEDLNRKYNKGAQKYDDKILELNRKVEALGDHNEKLTKEKLEAYKKAEEEFSNKLDVLDQQYRGRTEEALEKLEKIGISTEGAGQDLNVEYGEDVRVEKEVKRAPTVTEEKREELSEFEKMMLSYEYQENKEGQLDEQASLGMSEVSGDEEKRGFVNPESERLSLSIVSKDGNHLVNPDTGLINLNEKALAEKRKKEKVERDSMPVEEEEKKSVQLLTAGTLITGVLINGVMAPTSSSSEEEEQPVLIRVKGVGLGPNFTRVDVSECFVIGSAIGKLNTGRAYIRGRTLSCVNSEGGAIEVGLSSYAVGSDGQNGVRGNIISRNDTVLWNSTISGALSGFAEALSPSEVPVLFDTGDDNKIYQQASVGDVAAVAGYNGASSAFSELAKYYGELLKNLHPVIEVAAGEKIEMILLSGISVEL